MRPNFNDQKYKSIENSIEECFAYAHDLELHCNELEKQLKVLKERSAWLSALEAAGVDNWEGIDVAVEIFEESK